MGIQDFPDGAGGPTCVWAENLSFDKIFAKNCLKMKEIGPRGGASPAPLLRSASAHELKAYPDILYPVTALK